jgi:hypothetical protein
MSLAARIAARIERIKRDPSHPWVGLGIVRELEEIMQLLTLPEFAEWLRLHGGEHAKWADEILAAHDTATDHAELIDDIDDTVSVAVGQPYSEAIALAAADAATLHDVRAVLVERGALAADDRETELPDLIAALLS